MFTELKSRLARMSGTMVEDLAGLAALILLLYGSLHLAA